jgi:hypothetical protein
MNICSILLNLKNHIEGRITYFVYFAVLFLNSLFFLAMHYIFALIVLFYCCRGTSSAVYAYSFADILFQFSALCEKDRIIFKFYFPIQNSLNIASIAASDIDLPVNSVSRERA